MMSHRYLTNFCGSTFWDTSYTWYTDYPQFTPCFEQTVLAWIPVGFLIIVSPFELRTMYMSRASNIPWNWRSILKLVFSGIATGAILADVIKMILVCSYGGKYCPAVDWATPVVRLLSVVFAIVLVHRQRIYGVRASGLLFMFWLLVTIAGFFQLRREINKLQTGMSNFRTFTYIIYYFAGVILLLLNFLADAKPLINPEGDSDKPSPENRASFPSAILLTWFGKLTALGYKRPLVDDDLWDLNPENTSNVLVPGFQERLKRNRNKNGNKTSIVPILVSMFCSTFLKGACLEFITSLLVFVNPQILKLLINFVTNGEDTWKGILYASLLLVTATIQTILSSSYLNIEALISLRTTTILTSAIYRKALTLSSTARKTSTTGEIVNLMSVDVHRVAYFAGYINMVWSAPLEIFLAILFLWNILGWPVLVGFAVMILMVPISVFTAKSNKNIQKKYMNLKDRRIKLMSEILAGIKVMKLYAWESSYERMVLKIRDDEVKALKREAYFDALTTFVWTCAPYLVTLVSFTTYVLSGHTLTAETAFVSLSLFNILRFPFDQLPWMLTSAVQCKVAVTRINKYLNEEDLDEEAVEHTSPVGTFIPDLSLSMTDATFAWDRSEPAILKNINLNFYPNSLIAVVGPVGSGKSSLISAFLGEMEKLDGHISVMGSVAYAPQVPWIQNSTLKNNVLFGKSLDEEFYSKVIEACALIPDLDMLPGGDLTEIGEKGINLSGGQKQRISFARAVYSNADIYFLDDPMSAVDSHVGKHLFERVIGHGGLLHGKIRVLVTNVVTFLPLVDSIVVLEDGRVSEVGTYGELLERKGAFSTYLNCYAQESAISVAQAEINAKQRRDAGKRDRLISVTSKSSRLSKMDSRSITSDSSDDYSDDDIDNRKLIEKEKAEIEGVKWSVYVHFFKSTGPYVLTAMLLFNLLAESFMISSNFWLSAWSTDPTLVVNGTVDVYKRDVYLGVYGALGLGLSATAIFAYLAPVLGTLYASVKLHEHLLKRVMGAPMSFFDTVPSGRIVSRFSKDVDSLDSDLPHAISEFLFIFCEVSGILVVITVNTPIFILGIIPIGIVYYFIQRYYLATSRQLKRLESISRSPIYSHFSETIAGASVIRAYGFQPKFIKESEQKVDFNQKCCYYEIIANRWLGIRLETLGNLIIFFAALFVVFSRGSLSDGLTGLSLTYALEITEMLNWLVRSTAEVETSVVAVERIKQFEEISQESSSDIVPVQSWPAVGQIEFRNFCLRYREGLDLVLKNLTFTVKGGEKIGIVGRTGAGKSSLTLALFRIIEPAEGEILIDGIDVSKLRLNHLRSRITIIPQDSVLFSATIRVNLDPFDQHTDQQIWQALESSHLKQLVLSYPLRLNHEVAEGGSNFSAGQRQLICLARALLRKTKILVLDEATAAVDLETDDLIQATIRSEFSSCTILTIAHRINTVIDSDRVLVLNEGTVDEFENPSELLRDRQSLFYSLAKDAGLAS